MKYILRYDSGMFIHKFKTTFGCCELFDDAYIFNNKDEAIKVANEINKIYPNEVIYLLSYKEERVK